MGRGNLIPTQSRLLVAARDNRQCIRCGSGNALHWHHRRARRVKDDHTHQPCNGISLCTSDHAWVHAHPREAQRFGYIVSRSEPLPGSVPLLTVRWGWVLLDCEGDFNLIEEPAHARDL